MQRGRTRLESPNMKSRFTYPHSVRTTAVLLLISIVSPHRGISDLGNNPCIAIVKFAGETAPFFKNGKTTVTGGAHVDCPIDFSVTYEKEDGKDTFHDFAECPNSKDSYTPVPLSSGDVTWQLQSPPIEANGAVRYTNGSGASTSTTPDVPGTYNCTFTIKGKYTDHYGYEQTVEYYSGGSKSVSDERHNYSLDISTNILKSALSVLDKDGSGRTTLSGGTSFSFSWLQDKKCCDGVPKNIYKIKVGGLKAKWGLYRDFQIGYGFVVPLDFSLSAELEPADILVDCVHDGSFCVVVGAKLEFSAGIGFGPRELAQLSVDGYGEGSGSARVCVDPETQKPDELRGKISGEVGVFVRAILVSQFTIKYKWPIYQGDF